MLLTGLFAQQKTTVDGKVTDSKGAPIPGATIKEKGTKSGVAADLNGSFHLMVNPGSTLIISAIGFTEQQVKASANLVIQLIEDSKDLGEVVVTTALGVKRRPKELGYSVGKVTNDDITNGRSPTLANSLSGKVSGLAVYNVNNSVDPQVKITLRGYRSMTETMMR